ncbi:MAG: hypothetical protein ACREC5_06765 [Thermoplasmata archaeon]
MPEAAPRIAWIVAPPEVCAICGEPLTRPAETSSWNGRPAHRECVRIRLIQRDPAFRDLGVGEEPFDPEGEAGIGDESSPREDDDEEMG